VQRKVPVEPNDTEETLSARILEREHEAYPEAIVKVLDGLETPRKNAPESVHRPRR